MIWAIRTLLWFAVLTVALVAAATYLPAWLRRAQVPPDFEEIGGLVPMTGVWLDPPPYQAGDVLAYRFGDGPEDITFAFIAALPGSTVRLGGGELLVDGNQAQNWHEYGGYRDIHDIGPLTVPAGHYYVVSKEHRHDSLSMGVIGPDQILGKVRE